MEQKKIEEVNQFVKTELKNVSDICVEADADKWAESLDYDNKDLINATIILMHVSMNKGIKSLHIGNGKVADVYGKRLRELVKDMTGVDVAQAFREEYGKK